MQFLNIFVSFAALALPSLVDATNIDNHLGENCGGGYLQYTNIPSNVCARAYIQSGSNIQGSRSIYFSNKPSAARSLGWQSTRDGNNCGSLLVRGNGGRTAYCMLAPNDLQFAGSSWASGARKRFEGAASEECTSTAKPSALVLNDGHKYGLQGLNDTVIQELYDAAASGATASSLPSKFHAYEVDAAGVQSRLVEMSARQGL